MAHIVNIDVAESDIVGAVGSVVFDAVARMAEL